MNRFIWLVVLSLVLVACTTPTPPLIQPTPTATKPQVIITSPSSNMQYRVGTSIAINSTSSDAQGIVRVELLVDGQSIRSDPIPSGKSQPHFQVVQTWNATTPGAHIVVVRATNEAGATSESALSLTVVEPTRVPTRTPYISPTRPPVVAIATRTPTPIRTAAPSARVPTPAAPPSTPAPTLAAAQTIVPTATRYTLTLTEEQFSAIANAALLWAHLPYAYNAAVTLQNGRVAFTATFSPPDLKPTILSATLNVSASNCDIRATVVGATYGLSALSEEQKIALGQSVAQLLKIQIAQQRNYTCIDSIGIANAVMTITYH
ncbi:MAG: Ig-like domain-containing protein [Chloroflexota bacterium]